jgi:hypothetical protein
MGPAFLEAMKRVCTPPSEIGTLGAFYKPSEAAEKKLVRSDERLIQELSNVLDRQLIAAVNARSKEEFESVRQNVIPRYARALRAIQDTVMNLITPDMLQALLSFAVTELAEDLEKQRESRFGEKLTEQALFSLWMVPKIADLAQRIVVAGEVPPDKRAEDLKLLNEYHSSSLWMQFHLDVLFESVKFDRPICEPIRETICDGLRASVNAYVIMKDALSLRQPRMEDAAPAPPLPWDEEDEQLLAQSMRDRNAHSPGEG